MLDLSEVEITTMRGKGPGGQHRNKTDSCVRVVHRPTGIEVVIDGRKQHQNRVQALRELERRLAERKAGQLAAVKKARRDHAIQDGNTPIIRTYDYKDGMVRDHRTKKKAPLKEVLGKGRIELLR
jgi:peptide chain release factor 1